MKATTTKRKSATRQKTDSRKEPAMERTARSPKAPVGERKDPPSEVGEGEPASFRAKSARSRAAAAARESAEQSRPDVVDEIAQEIDEDSDAKHARSRFHLPQEETRREHHLHEKGHIEADAMLSRIPPAKSPGQPGSPPRIMQRRAVYERGNRYPLTHAPKS